MNLEVSTDTTIEKVKQMYLYHATPIKNKISIEKNGLVIGCKPNWDGMYITDFIFLAVNPNVAEDYVIASDTYNGEDIVIYQIDLNNIDQSKIYYDWNNRCEYADDINSVAYKANIPHEFLELATDSNQKIEDFKGTLLYEQVMKVFNE